MLHQDSYQTMFFFGREKYAPPRLENEPRTKIQLKQSEKED